eukprot:TRINITY_DN118014_c0_g1_i1.p1 TRINITY_DN118014_c0_g1~~TRINITY_DN118014_c0_g1_i1.p1  ORF type:complete len:117 (+),score=12.51 TRINITY_DN118014_c0_g1_i1:138-488(+)
MTSVFATSPLALLALLCLQCQCVSAVPPLERCTSPDRSSDFWCQVEEFQLNFHNLGLKTKLACLLIGISVASAMYSIYVLITVLSAECCKGARDRKIQSNATTLLEVEPNISSSYP